MIFSSRSQAGQDRFAYEIIGSTGTFLDIGANDPITNSNSYALEQMGWKGLLVDFDEAMVNLCKTRRTNPVILADATKVNWTEVCSQNGLTKNIDYLSLDVDGPELTVLMNLVSEGFSFRVITCEHDRYHRGDAPRESLRCFFIGHGYTLAKGDVKVYDQHYPNGVEFEDWWLRQ